MKKIILFLCITCFMCIGFHIKYSHSTSFTFHGSTTVRDSVIKKISKKLHDTYNLHIHVRGNGSNRGVVDLSLGEADFAMISTSVEVMKKKVPKAPWDNIIAHPIGFEHVSFIVNHNNPVYTLSLEQIKSILSGEITHWSEVGGDDIEIAIVAERKGRGMRSMVESKVLDGDSIKGNLIELSSPRNIIKKVSGQYNAIGVINDNIAQNQTGTHKILSDFSIVLPLQLLTLGPLTSEQKKILEIIRQLNYFDLPIQPLQLNE